MMIPFLFLAAGCLWGWETVDWCDEDGCQVCTSDADCVTGYSCCSEELYCMHRDEDLMVCQLGCLSPDPPPCTCQEGVCGF